MERYAVIEKRVGETPLQAMEAWRTTRGIAPDVPLSYAGRLDPMASGKLLILIGEECKKQKDYQKLDKAYDFEILLGLASDTGDVLGLGDGGATPLIPSCSLSSVESLRGPLTLPYPHYSSKTVEGKPLFLWTLEGRLDEIEVPTAHTRLYRMMYRESYTKNGAELLAHILEKIDSIPQVTEASKELGADFRRGAIRARWHELLVPQKDASFQIARYSCICASGTYIRSLAPHIAKMLDTKGLALSIHRTRIGRYIPLPRNLGGFWLKSY